jgi:hypothetical protein
MSEEVIAVIGGTGDQATLPLKSFRRFSVVMQ